MSKFRIGTSVLFFRTHGDMEVGVVKAIYNAKPDPEYTIAVTNAINEVTNYRVQERSIMETVDTRFRTIQEDVEGLMKI